MAVGLSEDVDKKGKILVIVRDTRGAFSDKSGRAWSRKEFFPLRRLLNFSLFQHRGKKHGILGYVQFH